jgi:hypothetical protein
MSHDPAIYAACRTLLEAKDYTSLSISIEGVGDHVSCGLHPGFSDRTLAISWADCAMQESLRTACEFVFEAETDRKEARKIAAVLLAWADTEWIHQPVEND